MMYSTEPDVNWARLFNELCGETSYSSWMRLLDYSLRGAVFLSLCTAVLLRNDEAYTRVRWTLGSVVVGGIVGFGYGLWSAKPAASSETQYLLDAAQQEEKIQLNVTTYGMGSP